MVPFTSSDDIAQYISHRIVLGEYQTLSWYHVAPSLRTYITMYVELTEDDAIGAKRYTPMHYRDMMVDNYLTAGGDLRTWQYIGTNSIVNKPTRKLFEDVFQSRGIDSTQSGSVEFLPSDKRFADIMIANPFTRGIQGLLQKYERQMGNAKVKRLVFISDRVHRPFLRGPKPEYNLVVELCRPGEDGYPNKEAS